MGVNFQTGSFLVPVLFLVFGDELFFFQTFETFVLRFLHGVPKNGFLGQMPSAFGDHGVKTFLDESSDVVSVLHSVGFDGFDRSPQADTFAVIKLFEEFIRTHQQPSR